MLKSPVRLYLTRSGEVTDDHEQAASLLVGQGSETNDPRALKWIEDAEKARAKAKRKPDEDKAVKQTPENKRG